MLQLVALYGLIGCMVVYLIGRGALLLMYRFADHLEKEHVEHL